MASPTRWARVWVNSGNWWWTGKPGMLRFMGSQRVGHDWATELNWLNWRTLWLVGLLPSIPNSPFLGIWWVTLWLALANKCRWKWSMIFWVKSWKVGVYLPHFLPHETSVKVRLPSAQDLADLLWSYSGSEKVPCLLSHWDWEIVCYQSKIWLILTAVTWGLRDHLVQGLLYRQGN